MSRKTRYPCVGYFTDRPGENDVRPVGWCICEDRDAMSPDHEEGQWTACGYVVDRGLGVELRVPTCAECLALAAGSLMSDPARCRGCGWPPVCSGHGSVDAANTFSFGCKAKSDGHPGTPRCVGMVGPYRKREDAVKAWNDANAEDAP